MDSSDEPSKTPASITPKRQSRPRGNRADTDEPSSRQTEAARGQAASEQVDSPPSAGSHKFGSGKSPPPVRQKSRSGRKRRAAKRKTATDLRLQILDQASAPVSFIEDGKRRKAPFGRMGARALVRSAMRGDSVAFAQVIQVLASLDRSPHRARATNVETRRTLSQIMRDFADDMHEEAYQSLREQTGRSEFSDEELSDKVHQVIGHKHSKHVDSDYPTLISFLMSMSVGDYGRFLRPLMARIDPTFDQGSGQAN